MGMVNITDSIADALGARILVVDGDAVSRNNVTAYLDDHAMRVTSVSGQKGLLHALSVREPDLIIIRLDTDEDSGLNLVREIRRRSTVPLFIVNRQNRDDIDRIVGLELGADEYLTEPYSLRELLARVRSALRRRGLDRLAPPRQSERCYAFGGWLFDQRARQLRNPSGNLVILTKGEFTLLGAFVTAPRRTLSREHLLQTTRVHEDVFDRSIDVQVLRLRRKLETDPQQPRLIRTVRGIGYVFDTDPELISPQRPETNLS